MSQRSAGWCTYFGIVFKPDIDREILIDILYARDYFATLALNCVYLQNVYFVYFVFVQLVYSNSRSCFIYPLSVSSFGLP